MFNSTTDPSSKTCKVTDMKNKKGTNLSVIHFLY